MPPKRTVIKYFIFILTRVPIEIAVTLNSRPAVDGFGSKTFSINTSYSFVLIKYAIRLNRATIVLALLRDASELIMTVLWACSTAVELIIRGSTCPVNSFPPPFCLRA